MTSRVHLLFPPLVYSAFGQYYPSIAVLSAYLKGSGIETIQRDLNGEFAKWLLTKELLERVAGGKDIFGKVIATSSSVSIAARLLLKNLHLIYDSNGKCFLGNDDALLHLVSDLISSIQLDMEISELAASEGTETAHFLQSFFEYSGCVKDLLDDDIVGISVAMGPQIIPSLILAKFIRLSHPRVKIVLGGAATSLLDDSSVETLLRSAPSVDCLVRYDGEFPLVSICQQLDAGYFKPESIPNVSSIGGGRIVHVSPLAGPSLDDLPFADYSPALLARLDSPELGVTLSRGCYWGRCAYCDFVELYKGSASVRMRKAKNVVAEMLYLQGTHGVERFSLITESIPAGAARRISAELERENAQLKWNSFCMVDQRFTDQDFFAMARSGCDGLLIGLETLVTRVLKNVEKSATREESIEFLNAAVNAEIPLYINLIPDLPTTTYEEALAALKELESMSYLFRSVGVFPFEATASSKLGRNPEKYGLQVLNNSFQTGQAEFSANHLRVDDCCMTDSEREEVYTKYNDFSSKVYLNNLPSKNDRPGMCQPVLYRLGRS